MMANRSESEGRSGARFFDVAAIVVFIMSLVAWWLGWDPIVLVLREWAIYPEAGDAAIGLIVFGPAVLGISLLFLVASVILSRYARHLPMSFRVLTVVSPALGCLVGLAIIYRAVG